MIMVFHIDPRKGALKALDDFGLKIDSDSGFDFVSFVSNFGLSLSSQSEPIGVHSLKDISQHFPFKKIISNKNYKKDITKTMNVFIEVNV